MPEISRFFGVIIRMFWEPDVPHSAAHFHAYYQGEGAVFSIEPVELIAGNLPKRQLRLVMPGRNFIVKSCLRTGSW